jgi:hypothetical protein
MVGRISGISEITKQKGEEFMGVIPGLDLQLLVILDRPDNLHQYENRQAVDTRILTVRAIREQKYLLRGIRADIVLIPEHLSDDDRDTAYAFAEQCLAHFDDQKARVFFY